MAFHGGHGFDRVSGRTGRPAGGGLPEGTEFRGGRPAAPERDGVVMGSYRRRGGPLAGLWNCCLAVLILALVVVCGFWLWLVLAPIHHRHEARDAMEDSVARSRAALEHSAADGELLGTEIQRDLTTGAPSLPNRMGVQRRGDAVTVTARFTGTAPGFITPTRVDGCYRFRVVPPHVSVRSVSEDECLEAGDMTPSPAQVADDVVGELRAALAHGGLDAVQRAEVWKTYGIDVTARRGEQGRLTQRALLRGVGGTAGAECYEFRVRAEPPSVTARTVPRADCSRLP